MVIDFLQEITNNSNNCNKSYKIVFVDEFENWFMGSLE